ncbi:MAG TPA: hypothetical protein VNT54_09530, partial [Solirubrobacteraceae bacterium]|nr:hypothetical protein [Solirubrobacteraceae bacterium]
MAHRGKHSEREPKPGPGAGLFSGGAVAMVAICCGGHALALGLLGVVGQQRASEREHAQHPLIG